MFPYISPGFVIPLEPYQIKSPFYVDGSEASREFRRSLRHNSLNTTNTSQVTPYKDLDDDAGIPRKRIELVTVNDSPRVFLLKNFIGPHEAKTFVETSLKTMRESLAYDEKTQTFRPKPGSRTSENSFDFSNLGTDISERATLSLGFPRYVYSLSAGVQVLRYNTSKAYVAHHDFHQQTSDPHFIFSPLRNETGANRFATVSSYSWERRSSPRFVILIQLNSSPNYYYPFRLRPHVSLGILSWFAPSFC